MWKAGKQIKSFSNKTGFTKRGVHTLPESQDASKNLVVLQYEDLKSKNLFEKIEKAFGREGLGALTIRGIPVRFFKPSYFHHTKKFHTPKKKFAELRKKLIPLTHKVAHLPEEAKRKLEDAESMYNAGWSHGKEKLGDEPDFAKGSFYGNPLYDVAAEEDVVRKYPFFFPKNVWPSQEIPELEGLFKELGRVMFDSVVLLSEQIDRLIAERVSGYERASLYREISTTRKVKGRMLYYFPTDKVDVEDAWIGFHNDSGFLTGEIPALLDYRGN